MTDDLSTEEMLNLQRLQRWSDAAHAIKQKRANEVALGRIAALVRQVPVKDSLDRFDTLQIRDFLAQAGWLS